MLISLSSIHSAWGVILRFFEFTLPTLFELFGCYKLSMPWFNPGLINIQGIGFIFSVLCKYLCTARCVINYFIVISSNFADVVVCWDIVIFLALITAEHSQRLHTKCCIITYSSELRQSRPGSSSFPETPSRMKTTQTTTGVGWGQEWTEASWCVLATSCWASSRLPAGSLGSCSSV